MGERSIILGKFGRPHGVRGEIRFFPYNPDTELIEPGLRVIAGDEPCVFDTVRPHDRCLIVSIAGCEGRDDIERFKNREVSVPRDALPDLDDDEVYLADLIGYDVVGRERADEEPLVLGTLQGFLDSTAVDVMIVTGPRIRKRLLVPMTDHALERIDYDAGVVVLHPFEAWMPEGETVLLAERGD